MKQSSTLFLKATLIVMGITALGLSGFLVWLSGNAESETYRPILAPILIGMSVAVIPFCIALYQAFLLLTLIDLNKAFSEASIRALQNIKYCGMVISGWYAVGFPYLVVVAEQDDAPGAVLVGLIIIGASFVVAVFAAVLQRLLRNGLDIQSENDLTV